MDDRTRDGIALALKWFGAWLVFTAALMLYGETAPSVVEPRLFDTTLCALAGLACFYGGGWWTRRDRD
ncbi:MAG: hypothetical protein AB7U81_14550 [Thiohalomonadaceae bacterium]